MWMTSHGAQAAVVVIDLVCNMVRRYCSGCAYVGSVQAQSLLQIDCFQMSYAEWVHTDSMSRLCCTHLSCKDSGG